jgi:FkbH-like protein
MTELREDIDRAIDAGDHAAARSLLAMLWRDVPGPATAGFVTSRFERIRDRIALTPCRVAILRSFTVEPIVPLLRASAFASGIAVDVHLGGFNQYHQEIVDHSGALYRHSPSVVILAVLTSDLAPSLWSGFADLDSAGVDRAVGQAVATLRTLIERFRAVAAAPLVVHTLEMPDAPVNGILDLQRAASQTGAINWINQELAAITRATRNVYLLDYNTVIARRGRDSWRDDRKALTSGMPIAANALTDLAEEWVRFLHPLTGRVCKVLVTDLDDTIWGGIVGEDGVDGIKLGAGYPGAAYLNVQRAMLDLSRRGILLAVCSKNNPAEALDALANHPDMLLRPEHFAAMRIGWNDKAEGLEALAADLNVSTDSLAFLDDNPLEREWVRSRLPEVTVIELPADPMQFARTLRHAPVFERLELSDEDRSRGRYYAEQRLRSEMQQAAGSLEDFYRSLRMQVRVEPVTAATLTRAAQLSQKTNQFNLTTRRYSERELESLQEPRWRKLLIRVADRFGDNGIVGLAILRIDGSTCDIDTMLLSCRVIGRTVESAFLALLADEARQAGASTLTGSFIPTRKNAPAQDFFRSHGFSTIGREGDTLRWELSLRSTIPAIPEWIAIETRQASL